MKIRLEAGHSTWEADLSRPVDLSVPLRAGAQNPIAWYCGPVVIKPVITDQFTGDVNLGGSVNFRDIHFNPHGHGTHTECVGHISSEPFTINQALKTFFFVCRVVSVAPEVRENGDQVVTRNSVEALWSEHNTPAIVIRTLPNTAEKLAKNYSNTNPPYLEAGLADFLVEKGVDHLLVDLPSVDREVDGGVLDAHHRFWRYPIHTRTHATITELIYVPDSVADGIYLLNLQIASFENDASPSKPVLYELQSVPL
jgi:kynurenine formamidase